MFYVLGKCGSLILYDQQIPAVNLGTSLEDAVGHGRARIVFSPMREPEEHPMDILKIAWHNLLQKPLLDRIFYVPFWECPFQCAFCCVSSLPGRPPSPAPDHAQVLSNMLRRLARLRGGPVDVHYYGGEPLLRPDVIVSLARTLLPDPAFGRLTLYSTLRPPGLKKVLNAIPTHRLSIVVNPNTATPDVHAVVKDLGGVAAFYKNPTVFPTGRGAVGQAGYRKSFVEQCVSSWMPGRSCFANASGMLLNGAHRTMHLCCLPQSPVVGTFEEEPDVVLGRYLDMLPEYHKDMRRKMNEKGFSHACSVCQEESAWDTAVPPSTAHLVRAPDVRRGPGA